MVFRVSGFIQSLDATKLTLSDVGDLAVPLAMGADSTVDAAASTASEVELPDNMTPELLATLDQMKDAGIPVMAQLDAKNNTNFFCPIRALITKLVKQPSEKRVQVSFFGNPYTNYSLLESNENFDTLLARLELAKENNQLLWVAVVDIGEDGNKLDGFGEIVDIVGEIKNVRLIDAQPVEFEFDESLHYVVPAGVSQEIFQDLNDQSTPPTSTEDVGIPFLFVESGCIPRTHEMCRLIRERKVQPYKIWAFDVNNSSNLVADTVNHPDCFAEWSFHVAPMVRTTDGFYVVDPTIANGALPVVDWQNKFSKGNSRLFFTSDSVYSMTSNHTIISDPHFEETKEDLKLLRICLKLFSHRFGAPPYMQCQSITRKPVGKTVSI